MGCPGSSGHLRLTLSSRRGAARWAGSSGATSWLLTARILTGGTCVSRSNSDICPSPSADKRSAGLASVSSTRPRAVSRSVTRTLTQAPRSAARMAGYLLAPPATPTRRGTCIRSAGVILMTRSSSDVFTVPPLTSKNRRQTSPTAPAFRSWSCSASVSAFPLCRNSGDGSRLPIPTRARSSSFHDFMTSPIEASLTRARRRAGLLTSPGAGRNTGRAPVTAASSPVSRFACTCTPGSP